LIWLSSVNWADRSRLIVTSSFLSTLFPCFSFFRSVWSAAEATVALACAADDVSLAVQAKREIGKLWEDITKAPYRALFNPSVTGPEVWRLVRILRTAETTLQSQQKKRRS
jgi:hypothetical protein